MPGAEPSLATGSVRIGGRAAPALSLFGLRMRRARIAAGLTPSNVFERTGVHATNLSRIEHGRRYLANTTIASLASVYGVGTSQLVAPDSDDDVRGQGFLSEHLSVAEFVTSPNVRFQRRNQSQWLARPDHRENARWLASVLFEPVRAVLDVPLQIIGGYRAQDVHRLILIDGTEIPGHTHGLAVDVIPRGMPIPEAMAKLVDGTNRGGLEALDFATVEYGRWIHIQAPPFDRAGRKVVVPSLPS